LGEGGAKERNCVGANSVKCFQKSDDLVKRNVKVHELDALSVSDLTYIGTKEEWLYFVKKQRRCPQDEGSFGDDLLHRYRGEQFRREKHLEQIVD
jgi:hypothetical protein